MVSVESGCQSGHMGACTVHLTLRRTGANVCHGTETSIIPKMYQSGSHSMLSPEMKKINCPKPTVEARQSTYCMMITTPSPASTSISPRLLARPWKACHARPICALLGSLPKRLRVLTYGLVLASAGDRVRCFGVASPQAQLRYHVLPDW